MTNKEALENLKDWIPIGRQYWSNTLVQAMNKAIEALYAVVAIEKVMEEKRND